MQEQMQVQMQEQMQEQKQEQEQEPLWWGYTIAPTTTLSTGQ